jgi:ABC-2 type transport system permease protein
MKDNFRGWKSVFAFTFRQATKGAGFKFITTLVAILVLGAFVVTNVMVAKRSEDDKGQPSPIAAVYVLDNSGLKAANYKEIMSQLKKEQFKHIDFLPVGHQPVEEVIRTAASKSSETIAVIIKAQESSYEIKAIIPKGSKIKKKLAEALLKEMSSGFEANKLMQAGLSLEQLVSVLKPSVVSLSEIGENTSGTAKLIKTVAPMVFSLLLYLMLQLYGQSISKSVSTEKTSKLMEVLLTSVHPYALITGKVLAMTSIGLAQFVIWIAFAIAGLYGGNAVAHAIYPDYENTAITIINFVRDNIGETGMTLPAVVLSIIIFCLGFLFYCVIAAVAGCMVSKPEDAASTQAVFQLPIVISWLTCYIIPVTGNERLLMALRYIPFTAPFSVPVDLITGAIGLSDGIISMTLLLLFSFLTILLAARIYKGLVLYNGQKLDFKTIANILRMNK